MEILEQSELMEPRKYVYAGFWWRVLAYIIDDIIIDFASVLLFLPFYILMFAGTFGYSFQELNRMDGDFADAAEFLQVMGPFLIMIPILIILSVVLRWLYYAIMESSKHQGTVGKILLGLKVTDLAGNRINFARATGRFFGKIVSGMIFMIGYIMAAFTEKRQALHDIMADCLVVKVI